MKIFFFALIAGLFLQCCLSCILPAIRISITNTLRSSPQFVNANQRTLGSNCLLRNLLCKWKAVQCPNGKRSTFPANGCKACDDCIPKPECTTTPEPECTKTPEPECPMFKCQALQCPNGKRPTFLANGCRACDECIPEPENTTTPQPECPLLDCEELHCPYGNKSTVLSNGCPGCDECLPKPPCKKLLCIKPKCPNGTMSSVLSNGCPGCDVCKPSVQPNVISQ